MRQILIVIIFLLSQYHCLVAKNMIVLNKQESIIYSMGSVNRLNEKIGDLLKTSFCNTQTDSVYIYHIFHFNTLRKVRKSDLIDSNFFRKLLLLPDYETYMGYINSSAIILDVNGNFMGVAEPNYIYCKDRYNESYFLMELYLIKKRKDLDIQSYFTFNDNLYMNVVYGKTHNDKIYAFYKDKTNTFRIEPIEEFACKNFSD